MEWDGHLSANLIEPSTEKPGPNLGADPFSSSPRTLPSKSQSESDRNRVSQHGWPRFLRFCSPERRPRCAFALSACVAMAVALCDFFAPSDAVFSIFYLYPVSFGAWHGGRRVGVAVSLFITVACFFPEQYFRAPIAGAIYAWNACSRLAVYLFVTFLVAQLRDLKLNLESLVEERTAQLQHETAQRLQVEHQIAVISDREQERISHELHDDLGQHLAGLSFRMKALENDLAAAGVPHVAEARELGGLVTDAIRHTRLLARRLDPVELENHDLIAALQSLAAEIQRTYRVTCVLRVPTAAPELRVNREAGLALFRICQEAMHNAIHHGEARSLDLALSTRDGLLTLSIENDGHSFDPSQAPAPGQEGGGMGLRIMGSRAASIGGRLEINPGTPGTPDHARVSCVVPLQNITAAATPETKKTA